MSVYISRVQINNFRNFHELDVILSQKAVIVGENKSGKTNFIHALRLILDPDLPDSARQLKEEDFWDGLESPMEKGSEISISIELQGFKENERLLSVLSDYIVENGEKPIVRITYKYRPNVNLGGEKDELPRNKYEFEIYGRNEPGNDFGYQQRKWMPLQVLPALRDAETDLESWRRSPLRPLIERLSIANEELKSAVSKIDDATNEILRITDVGTLSRDIENRLKEMVGEFHSVSPSLGVASTDAQRLLRSLRQLLVVTKKLNFESYTANT
jgi:putative ATP-dependent endonuclease of OLD family